MTILGSHTVAELADLLAAYDYQLGQLVSSGQVLDASGAWRAADPTAAAQWKADLAAFRIAFATQSAAARALVDSTAIPSVTTAEDEYQALSKAFAPVADLDRRMRAAPSAAAVAPTYAATPQPTAADVDLGAFKATNAAARSMPAWAKTLVADVAPDLVPKDADAASYKPTPKWKIYAAAGAVAFVAILLVRR